LTAIALAASDSLASSYDLGSDLFFKDVLVLVV